MELAGLFNQLNAHDGIFVEELPGMFTVCADAANHGREMQHHRRLRVFEEASDRFPIEQIAITAARHKNICAAARFESRNDERAEETGAAGDNDPLFPPKVHGASATP